MSDIDGKCPPISQEEKYFNDVNGYYGDKIVENIVDIIFLEAHRVLKMDDSALQKSDKNAQYRSQIRMLIVASVSAQTLLFLKDTLAGN